LPCVVVVAGTADLAVAVVDLLPQTLALAHRPVQKGRKQMSTKLSTNNVYKIVHK
jgi:hypothetical protein